eukprot:3783721-Amphidinium_carterae.1
MESCLCMDRECICCSQAFVSHEIVQDEHALCTINDEAEHHRTINGEDVPLWGAHWGLVTRQIHSNEEEYHTEPCQKALLCELEKLHQKGVWDHDTVMEY